MVEYNFSQRAVAAPDAPQKPLVRKRSTSGNYHWVQVKRLKQTSREAKRKHIPDQVACPHPEHHLLSPTEVTSFRANYMDRQVQPTKARSGQNT